MMTMQTTSFLSLIHLLIIHFASCSSESQHTATIQSPRLLDLLIRDFAVNLTSTTNIRTGTPFSVPLPANLSGASAVAVRLRCGSFNRYGAQMGVFRLPPGVSVRPCVERVLLVRQTLGHNWFHLYQNCYNLSGYRFITPVVGILAYNAGDDLMSKSDPFELGIFSAENPPIKIDFKKLVNQSNTSSAQQPNCATFRSAEVKVKAVVLTRMVQPFVCSTVQQGHFALVVVDNDKQLPPLPPVPPKTPPKSAAMVRDGGGERVSTWKLAVGSSIGAALGAFLLGLLLIAMLVRAKQRTKMEDLARRAYEEEALQVSMVGHVRAPVAPATRTPPPATDHRYRPPFL